MAVDLDVVLDGSWGGKTDSSAMWPESMFLYFQIVPERKCQTEVNMNKCTMFYYENSQSPTVEDIVNLLVQAVKASFQFIRETAMRKAKQWTLELASSYRSPSPLKRRISDALGSVKDLSLEQKTKVWELVEQFLNTKTTAESVPQI